MSIGKRVRRSAGITAKGLDRIMKRSLGKRKQIAVLKGAIFSNDRGLRRAVAEDLISRGQFRFLLKTAKRARRQDFSDEAFKEKFNLKFENMFYMESKRDPDFKFNGFEVYEVANFPQNGVLFDGRIVINKNLPDKLKPVLCAHEVGEIFNHKIGIAMELVEVKRRNLEKDYINHIKSSPSLSKDIQYLRERASLIQEHMPEMQGLAKQLWKILKAITGLASGP